MKVRLKVGMADANACHKAGTVIDVSPKEAKQLVEGGYAEAQESFPAAAPESDAAESAPEEVQVADAPAVSHTAESPVVNVRRPQAPRGPAPVAPSEDAKPAAEGEQSSEPKSE